MFKKLLTVLFALVTALSLSTAFAAVDANKATEAELDSVKGIGPVTSRLIMAERKKGEFKNWADFIGRVKGVGDKSAAKFSAEGLTVSGAAYTGPGAADAKKTDKPAAEKVKDGVKGAAVSTKETAKEVAKDVKTAVTPKPDAKVEPAKPAASAAKK
ncbi:MAG: ComEA family DNA-binding protein [Polaromonas sp.]